MSKKDLFTNVPLIHLFLLLLSLLFYVTSAEFNLDSLNNHTTNKSLDTFNQDKITLNNTGDYYNDTKGDGPITLSEMDKQQKLQQQQQPYHKAKENEQLLLLLNTTIRMGTMTTKNPTKYLTNQKLIKAVNIAKQPATKRRQQQNANNFYRYLQIIKFNKRNNEKNNNDYNFNLNNKLKTITTTYATNSCCCCCYEKSDAKDSQQQHQNANNNVKETADDEPQKQKQTENIDNSKVRRYQTKYYVAAKRFSSREWLGHLPQFPIQMQLFLQQLPQQQKQQSTAATAAWPHEHHQHRHRHRHHHLDDYRLLFFNAERQTQFYLHTSHSAATEQNDIVATTAETLASFGEQDVHNENNDYEKGIDDDDDGDQDGDGDGDDNKNNETFVNLTYPKHLNLITDAIATAFGVNTRPVAATQGIHIEEIELHNRLSLRASRFNPFNPCRILIHGWLGGLKAGIYTTLVPEYFKLQQGSYNIFTVDWSRGAVADYITASYRVKSVGIVVAKFIDFLHRESGILFENIHVIGFSMGAHIAGIAGKHVRTGRLPVIYGLDPAAPLFRYENVNERLDIGDANYVEVIHTSVGSYGYDHPLGHVDFYVNFGYNQPGCFFNECSHFRAFQVYAQSLHNERLMGVECSADLWWDMIKRKRCLRQRGSPLRLGIEGLSSSEVAGRRGIYYLATNAQAPYRL